MANEFSPLSRCLKQHATTIAAGHSVGRAFILHSHAGYHKRLLVLLCVLKHQESSRFVFWAVPNVIVIVHAVVGYLNLNFESSLHIRSSQSKLVFLMSK